MPAQPIIDTQAQIETPENVRLSFRLAGPGTRSGAYLVDFLIRAIILFGLGIAIGMFVPFLLGAGFSIGVFLLCVFLLEWFYGCLFEGFWSGRTPGKWVMGLRVIKEAGYPIGFYDAVLRNLLRAADALPLFYGAGFIVMLSTGRLQRLGDLLAGTIVVREKRERLRGQLPFLRSVPTIRRSDRMTAYRPSDRTLDLIERFFLRRAELAPSRADEIARILARPLADRLGLAQDSNEVVREPSRFLLRVLRTFSEADDISDDSRDVSGPFDPTRAVAVLLEGKR
jgi:uncharacterized RDD family membrane protein YckC